MAPLIWLLFWFCGVVVLWSVSIFEIHVAHNFWYLSCSVTTALIHLLNNDVGLNTGSVVPLLIVQLCAASFVLSNLYFPFLHSLLQLHTLGTSHCGFHQLKILLHAKIRLHRTLHNWREKRLSRQLRFFFTAWLRLQHLTKTAVAS